MSSIRKIERNRGLKESREQIKVLQDKWPAAFPKQASLVRPLANGAPKTIAEAFGWSVAYTRAVLMVWKSRAAYCTAVLAHAKRINLDGSTSDEEVDEKACDEALEAWILVATRSVPEQLAQGLVQKGERLGVPVIVVDWKDHELAPLAALCALDPDLIEAEFSKDASEPARALQPVAGNAIAALRRNLQSWCLGFESLRSQSHCKLDSIWTLPRSSNAELGQDAAGGAQPKKVRRRSAHDALTAWWQGPARTDSPAAVIGWDGVGKTWAVLDWLTNRKADQPIVLIVRHPRSPVFLESLNPV